MNGYVCNIPRTSSSEQNDWACMAQSKVMLRRPSRSPKRDKSLALTKGVRATRKLADNHSFQNRFRKEIETLAVVSRFLFVGKPPHLAHQTLLVVGCFVLECRSDGQRISHIDNKCGFFEIPGHNHSVAAGHAYSLHHRIGCSHFPIE
jgi:hypothetical protein